MRTTLTLDRDLLPRVERLRKERGVSRARVVNELIRAGLAAPTPKRRPYALKSRWRARSLVGPIDNIGEALALAEGDSYR